MKRTLIITLLLLVAAFSFGQTNSTFNNLDVRNTTKLRGLIYPFGAVATSPINTAVHEVAMINNTTFALCRMDFEEFADSIANYLNPIIGTHWYTVPPDTIKTLYNVVVDSSFKVNYIDGDTSSFLNIYKDSQYHSVLLGNSTPDMNSVIQTWIYNSLIPYTYLSLQSESNVGSSIMTITPVNVVIQSDSTVIDGNLNVTGQVKYDYKHLVIYTTGAAYTPNVANGVEFKLTPSFSTTENDGFTFAGDSITIITPGDYFIIFSTVLQGANGSDWVFKCRKNGTAITTGNLALSTTGREIISQGRGIGIYFL